MLIRKRILSEGVSKIDLIKNIIVTEQAISEIKFTFEQLRDAEIIIAKQFEDVEWKYKSEVYNKPYLLTFNLEYHSKFNELLKMFAIVRIVNQVAPSTIALEIRYLKRIIIVTKGLIHLGEYHSMCENISSPEAGRVTRTLRMFSEFSNLPNKDEITNECKKYLNDSHKNRDLPDFTHVMTYDKCIDHYFTHHDELETIKYLPILLWWRLTTIIPMRPSELLLLKYNCIEVNDPLNEYWIKITRIKDTKVITEINEKQVLKYDKVQIDKATYLFIKKYQNTLNMNIKDATLDYLFPYSLHQKSVKQIRKVNHSRMDLFSFRNQLQKFYTEVIVGYYGFNDCVKIRPGDTRHFAIINMFLQGYNPLSIARMAGHNTISTQENYYNHTIHFAESHIYHLAQQKFENRTNIRIVHNTFGNSRDLYNRGLQYTFDELQHYRKVEYGYCKDLTPEFPENCVDNCLNCKNYIFKPAINEQEAGFQKLTEYSSKLGSLIKEEIENIFQIGKRINKDNLIRVDESLKNKSRVLSRLMNAKISVDSIKLEVDLSE